ncbi:hypothetical protein ACJ73_05282, partial [Blastomyces percursus]
RRYIRDFTLITSKVLSPHGQLEYFRMLQTFPFPRGWNRLQSLITHLKKYQLQEHARASIIIPLALHCGLREDWLSSTIKQTIPAIFSAQNQSPIDLIIQVYAAIARSNSLLMVGRICILALHYVEHIKEYAVFNNCNVLAEEDKHRGYKNLVQRTNHRDVEKPLLLQESFRRTLHSLFNNLLRMNEEADEDNDSPNYSVRLEPTKDHIGPKIFSRLSSSKMSDKVGIHFTNLSKLELLHPFVNKLRESYDTDWNKPLF